MLMNAFFAAREVMHQANDISQAGEMENGAPRTRRRYFTTFFLTALRRLTIAGGTYTIGIFL